MPVRHVQKYVTPAPQSVKENPAWKNVKNYVWLVQKHVENVLNYAKIWIQILQNQLMNVLKHVEHVKNLAESVQKNVKSIQKMRPAENALKLAENVKPSVKSETASKAV